MSISVRIVDDESLIVSSLATLLGLEDDIDVQGTSESAAELMAALDRDNALGQLPDVIVMDLHMPDKDGLQTSKDVLATFPGMNILIVTSHARPRGLKRAMSAGVRGFLPKTADAEEFATAIRSLHAGNNYLDQQLAVQALSLDKSPLTDREVEVLEQAGTGASVNDIAVATHLAPGTTRNYLSSAMSKTGATNRFDAFHKAREAGWL